VLDRVGEVELPLRVVGVEVLEGAPERIGLEEVEGGVQLLDRALILGRVLLLDDAEDFAVFIADDAPVRQRHR
jgi:hypothetical protein